MPKPWDDASERLLRELAPRALGAVARRFHDFAAAEDAVQEALLAAFTQWPGEGSPEHPLAWLIQVASRRITDGIRGDAARREREAEAARFNPAASWFPEAPPSETDDTLILLFMCCHPALTTSSAIALTLRAVGGLTTAEIAAAYLVPEATMAQRISRAKQSIRASGAPFRLPSPAERAERLPAVLHVLYLIFNEGYASSAGKRLQRLDLAQEAIRLARCAKDALPGHPEAAGLLALMLLTDARRAARTGPGEELIPLNKQDRALWDHAEIAEGLALLSAALAQGAVGTYQLQAAIAAVHDEAPRPEDTDWRQILALYDLLKRVSPGPVVALNYAVAAAMVHGPAKGIELLDALEREGSLAEHHRPDAVRAHLLEMLGDRQNAIEHYRAAAARTNSLPERNYLMAQAARLEESSG
ncbi:MAG TPA: DUF6596 domain-containing protein [Bryobacteraceae bacterium]|nr:DUF6596 domain-containing protein [Bryobacteraceae bacterium]